MKLSDIALALFEPEIPANTGNIGRLCVGLKASLYIVGKPAFLLRNRELKRAGLDYWEKLAFTHYESFDKFREASKERRVIIVSTKGKTPYYDFNYNHNDILLFGKESAGLPPHVWKEYDNSVYIPMSEDIRSHNLSNSAAIILYEIYRQRACKEHF